MWLLVSVENNDERYPILGDHKYVVGRQNCDIVIPDASASRKQAVLTMAHYESSVVKSYIIPTLTLEDVSKFGTSVNGKSVRSIGGNTTTLKHNDEIKFGGSPLSVYRAVYEPFIATTSCLEKAPKKSLHKVMCLLGGHLVRDWRPTCDLLIMSKINVTIKVICAINNQKHIVTPQYLDDLYSHLMGRQDKPDPVSYLPEVVDQEVPPGVSFHPDIRRQTLLHGLKFYFLSAVQFNKTNLAVSTAGGQPILLEDGTEDEAKTMAEDGTVVVAVSREILATLSSSCQKFVKLVVSALKRKNLRMVTDPEIGWAILTCNTGDFCNARSAITPGMLSSMAVQSMSQTTEMDTTQQQQRANLSPDRRTEADLTRSMIQTEDKKTLSQVIKSEVPSSHPDKQEEVPSSHPDKQEEVPSSHTDKQDVKVESTDEQMEVKVVETTPDVGRMKDVVTEKPWDAGKVKKSVVTLDLTEGQQHTASSNQSSLGVSATTARPAAHAPQLETTTRPASHAPQLETTTRPTSHAPQLETTTRPTSHAPQLETTTRPASHAPQLETTTRPASHAPQLETTTRPTSHAPQLETTTRPTSHAPQLGEKVKKQDKPVLYSPSVHSCTKNVDKEIQRGINEGAKPITDKGGNPITDEGDNPITDEGDNPIRGKGDDLIIEEVEDPDDDEVDSVFARVQRKTKVLTNFHGDDDEDDDDDDVSGRSRKRILNRKTLHLFDDDDDNDDDVRKRRRLDPPDSRTKLNSEVFHASVRHDDDGCLAPTTRTSHQDDVQGPGLDGESRAEVVDKAISATKNRSNNPQGRSGDGWVDMAEVKSKARHEADTHGAGEENVKVDVQLLRDTEGNLVRNLCQVEITELLSKSTLSKSNLGTPIVRANTGLRNFKKFKKTHHVGTGRLPVIIGGHDLEVYLGAKRKDIEELFTSGLVQENIRLQTERTDRELFNWDDTASKIGNKRNR